MGFADEDYELFWQDEHKTEEIHNAIDDVKADGDVNVIIASKSYKQDVNNNFVMLFYEALDDIIVEFQLTMLDLRVLMRLLRKASFGNLLIFKQSAIAKELKTSAPNISRTIKRMFKSNLLIKTEDGEVFINPHVISKGSLHKMKASTSFEELTQKSEFKNY